MTEHFHGGQHSRIGPSRRWCLLVTLQAIREQCVECGDCWEWQGGLVGGKYPAIRHRGKTSSARRVVYELSGHQLRDKSFIVTTCGNPRCLNPGHLKQQTQSQRMQQIGALGLQSGIKRSASIARTKRAQMGKITMQDAQQIRCSDETGVVLAERYGLSAERISKIRKGVAWRDYQNNPFVGLMPA